MERTTIWAKLTAVFRDLFDDPRLVVEAKTTARDIRGWDSLMHIQLVVALEMAFGVRFGTAKVAGVANVGEMVDLIASRLGAPQLAAVAS